MFRVLPEQKLDGPHGTGLVGYMIRSTATIEIVGVTEVERDIMSQGITQCIVQSRSMSHPNKLLA